MKKTHAAIAILTGLAAVAAVGQFTLTFAGPAAVPPGGNITPTFNGINLAASAPSTTVLSVSPMTAQISNNTSGPVIFNDAQGIALSNGGGITAISQDVKIVDAGTGTTRVDAQIPILNTTQPSGIGKAVTIADIEGLAIASNDPANISLTINGSTGNIQAPGSDLVTVADTDGLWVANNSAAVGGGLKINGGTGYIESFTGPVQVSDNDGFAVSDLTTLVTKFRVDGSTGGVYNPSTSGGVDNPLYLNDKTHISGNLGVGVTPGAHRVISQINPTAAGEFQYQASSPDGPWIGLAADTAAGSWNPMVNAGDSQIIYSGTAFETGGLVIGQWSNSSKGIKILSDGNVGIGTKNPTWKLEVNGGARFNTGGTGGAINLGSPWGQTGMTILNQNRADVRFDDSTLKLVAGAGTSYPPEENGIAINTSGNVGVGTTAPTAKLDVVGGGGQIVDFKVNGRIMTGGTGGNGGVWVEEDPTKALFMGERLGQIGFYNSGWRMVVDNVGNVGIGTTAPTADLHLSGSASQSIYVEADTDNSGEFDQPQLALSQDGGAVIGRLGYFDGSNNMSLYSEYAGNMTLGTNNVKDVITITSGGNVGMGTSGPGAKLDVNGQIIGNSIGRFYESGSITYHPNVDADPCYTGSANQAFIAAGLGAYYCSMQAFCSVGDIAIGSSDYDLGSYGSANNFYIFFSFLNSDNRTITRSFHTPDNSKAPGTWRVAAICFSPDG